MTIEANPAFTSSLVAARRHGERYRHDPACEPADLAQAFAAQAAVAKALAAEVRGWKVAFAPHSATPVAAPMFGSDFQGAGARVALSRGRSLIVEVELAFRLARDLAWRDRGYTREEILDAVDVALIGIEMIAGRVGESTDVAFPVWLADNMGNLGYVLGDETREFRTLDLTALRCHLRIGGETVYDAIGGHPARDPVEPLRAWASAQCDALGGLRAGQIVTTGSLSGATRVEKSTVVDADLSGVGAATLDVIVR